MKRFLGVLIASMFLASAAIAQEKAKDKTGEEKKAAAEGKADAKDGKDAKTTKSKDGKAGEKAAEGKTTDEKKAK